MFPIRGWNVVSGPVVAFAEASGRTAKIPMTAAAARRRFMTLLLLCAVECPLVWTPRTDLKRELPPATRPWFPDGQLPNEGAERFTNLLRELTSVRGIDKRPTIP